MSAEDEGEVVKIVDETRTISQQIIGKFITALSDKEGFSEIANRLEKVILFDNDLSTDSITSAIFQETESDNPGSD